MTKKSDANTKAKHTATLAALGKDAKAINASFIKAAKCDSQGDDNRLTAAVRIAAVKATCDKAHIKFKAWCEENITEQSYENVRKLAAVGASDNPAQALADMRSNNKAANKAARERTASATPAKASEPRNSVNVPTDFDAAVAAVGKLNGTGQVELCRSVLIKQGYAAIKKTDLEALHASLKRAEAKPATRDTARDTSACEIVGQTLNDIGDIGDIPAALKRAPAKRARKTAKRKAA